MEGGKAQCVGSDHYHVILGGGPLKAFVESFAPGKHLPEAPRYDGYAGDAKSASFLGLIFTQKSRHAVKQPMHEIRTARERALLELDESVPGCRTSRYS